MQQFVGHVVLADNPVQNAEQSASVNSGQTATNVLFGAARSQSQKSGGQNPPWQFTPHQKSVAGGRTARHATGLGLGDALLSVLAEVQTQGAGQKLGEWLQTSLHHVSVMGLCPVQDRRVGGAASPQTQISTGQNEGSWLQLSLQNESGI